MEIILHIGAHRSGTTTFQHYVRDQLVQLEAHSVGFWGPGRTRKSILPGLFRRPTDAKHDLASRAQGRVQMHLERARQSGVKQLLVSDENMIGSSRHCLRQGALYPAIGERMAHISAAFGGQVSRVLMTIRVQDLWWASAAALTVARGHPVPSAAQRDLISQSSRTWRDVIADLACAVPNADLIIMPFEQCIGSPQLLFNAATGLELRADTQSPWLNKSPNARKLRQLLAEQGADFADIPDEVARWQPFSVHQTTRLRENYADDLHWLTAGADGLAKLTEDSVRKRAGKSLSADHMTRGYEYDGGQRYNNSSQGHVALSG